MITVKTYVQKDSHGVWRIGESKISLDSIVYGYRQGFSAETIQDQYPALSLEEVHGAIAFYLANQAEIEKYLTDQEQVWHDLRQKAEEAPSPVLERLRAIRAASKEQNS